MKENELDAVHALWLKINLETHTTIDPNYFIDNSDKVKEALKDATIYVYKEDNTIIAFIGLIDDYIAGIFVDRRSKRIGYKLMKHIQNKHTNLNLHVFSDNIRAINFYKKHKFKEIESSFNEDVSAYETLMSWQK